MKMSLRVRLLGTIIGAIVLFFLISVVAARLVLTSDLHGLGATQAAEGAGAFGGYWDSRKDQIRLLIAQDAVSDAVRKSLASHNVAALQDQLGNTLRTSGLSFLTVVDTSGNVIARAEGSQTGSLRSDKSIQRALTGETVSTAALLDQQMLAGEGLGAQAQSDITAADGKSTVEHQDSGLALVAAAPISDQNERTIGAIYGGELMNHYYDLVDQSTQALGGSTGLLIGDAFVASTIHAPDGTRVVDTQDGAAGIISKTGQVFTGPDTVGGTEYLAHIEPLLSDQNKIVGVRWYGIPMAQISGIINDMTRTLLVWGLFAMVIALAIAIPIVERLSNTLAKRSHQVASAAKELRVAVVGSEVSGDHVSMTKAAVERIAVLISEIAGKADAPSQISELKAVNDELHGDMIVIDTLSQEMNNRMQKAVNRVADLNEVAEGLNELVTGDAAG